MFRTAWFFLITLILGIQIAVKAERDDSSEGQTQSGMRSRPLCIDDQKTIAEIKHAESENRSCPQKYRFIQEALKAESESELVARLAYSETLAANCPKKSRVILPTIAALIAKRMKVKKLAAAKVVFECNQFASSLNDYKESRLLDFLCPRDLALWQFSLDSAKRALAGTDSTPLAADTYFYFLYKHSPRWTKEPWKYPEDTGPHKLNVQDCVRFFRNVK